MPWDIRKLSWWGWLRKLIPFTNKELFWGGAAALAGLVLALTLVHFGVIGHKQPKQQVVPLPIPTPTTVVDGFKTKPGYFGTQYYVVSVHSETVQDGQMFFRPLGNCPNFMVVNLTLPVEDTTGLREKLAKVYGVNGVDGVEMHWYTVVIHRPCLPLREPFPSGVHQPWPWDRVWENVAPVLSEYFDPKKKK